MLSQPAIVIYIRFKLRNYLYLFPSKKVFRNKSELFFFIYTRLGHIFRHNIFLLCEDVIKVFYILDTYFGHNKILNLKCLFYYLTHSKLH